MVRFVAAGGVSYVLLCYGAFGCDAVRQARRGLVSHVTLGFFWVEVRQAWRVAFMCVLVGYVWAGAVR